MDHLPSQVRRRPTPIVTKKAVLTTMSVIVVVAMPARGGYIADPGQFAVRPVKEGGKEPDEPAQIASRTSRYCSCALGRRRTRLTRRRATTVSSMAPIQSRGIISRR